MTKPKNKLAYDARIVRLKQRLGATKWHICRTYGSTMATTACGITLQADPYALVQHKNGEPACKHCLRWWSKQKPWC